MKIRDIITENKNLKEGSDDFSRNLAAFRVYQHLDPMEFYNFANTPRGLKTLAQKAGTTPESVKDSLERMDWGQFPDDFYQDPEDDEQRVTEGAFTSQFKTKQQAVQYAKEKAQSLRDPEDGIEVWAMPDSGFNVVHTMNYSGRESVIARGGRKLGTVGPRQMGVTEGTNPTEQAMDQSISDLVKDAMGTRPNNDWMQRWMAMSEDKKRAVYQQLASQLD